MSMKFSQCCSLLCFHCGILFQSSISFRQNYIAWATSSLCDLQKSQVASVITFRLIRFVFEGRESQHPLHTKFFTLAGRLSFQIACQKCFTASGFKEPGCWCWYSFCRNSFYSILTRWIMGPHQGVLLLSSTQENCYN